MAPKLILTGFMATGKTVVARALARQLGWRLLDCDRLIATRSGKAIPQIFQDSGEDHFRALERALIAEIAADPRRCTQCGQPLPAVIATGGGTLADPLNYAVLKDCGIIVCLIARPEIIARRIGSGARARPMLTQGGMPLRRRIAHLMAERREAYARAAITVDTSERSVEQVAGAILEALAEYHPARWRSFA